MSSATLEAPQAVAKQPELPAQWIITADHLFDPNSPLEKDATGTCSNGYDPKLASEMTLQWRCFDDDGELYYEGIATPTTTFEPLDDFCQPNAGATSLQYRMAGKTDWKDL